MRHSTCFNVLQRAFILNSHSLPILTPPRPPPPLSPQSFKDLPEFKSAVIKRQPNKIDIGAVFTHQPKDHNNLSKEVFHTEERELVFDIDLTDYDGVRTCCNGANICNKCWKYMNMAIKVMDEGENARRGRELRTAENGSTGIRGIKGVMTET